MYERVDATAFVASVAWVRRNCPEPVVRGLAPWERMRAEIIEEAWIAEEDWNEACDQLQDYADRQEAAGDPDFASLKIEAEARR